MKVFAILLLLFIALQTKAQNIDSMALRLEHYKELRSQDLINNKEYQRLKSRVLNIPFDINTDADSIRARILKDKYLGRIRGGTIMMCVGGGLVFTSGILAGQGYNGDYYRKGRSPLLITGIIGGATFVAGAVILGLGLHSKILFSNEYLSLELAVDNNEIGVACNF